MQAARTEARKKEAAELRPKEVDSGLALEFPAVAAPQLYGGWGARLRVAGATRYYRFASLLRSFLTVRFDEVFGRRFARE